MQTASSLRRKTEPIGKKAQRKCAAPVQLALWDRVDDKSHPHGRAQKVKYGMDNWQNLDQRQAGKNS